MIFLAQIFLLSLGCLGLSCQTEQIQDAHTCAVAGVLSGGMDCSHLIGSSTSTLTFAEALDFLGPAAERTCVQVGHWVNTPPPADPEWQIDVPGVCAQDQTQGVPSKVPARGAAICMSSTDFRLVHDELATMCRLLGKRCSYATHVILEHLERLYLK